MDQTVGKFRRSHCFAIQFDHDAARQELLLMEKRFD